MIIATSSFQKSLCPAWEVAYCSAELTVTDDDSVQHVFGNVALLGYIRL